MNLRLWLQLFIHQLLLLGSVFIIIITVLVYGLDLVTLDTFLMYPLMSIPIYTWIIALVIMLSAFYSTYLMFRLNQPYEEVRAKLSWLALGKYHQPIFTQDQPSNSWYDNNQLVNDEIEELRQKLIQLSSDLQEFSAAPTFVGEDTKEEIIENERSRIARELHDSVSQQLFAATMMTSALNETIDTEESPKLKQQIKRIDQVIGSAQTEMRALLLHLRPIELNDRTLSEGIENVLTELNGKVPISVTWDLDETIRLESGIEDHLFRITQEAISNTLRHAQASKLEVFLSQTSDTIELKVIDDGIGFELSQVKQSGNYGLANMRERVTSLGGNIKVTSVPQRGTMIDITIPKTLKNYRNREE